MDPLTSFLAHARLAAIQCAWWGHPEPSGLPSIDYWITSDQDTGHETVGLPGEQLIQMSGLGVYWSVTQPPEDW